MSYVSGNTWYYTWSPGGNGTATITITGKDTAGNNPTIDGASRTSYTVDNIEPGIEIGAPVPAIVKNGGIVTYTVTYTSADSVTLIPGNVSITGSLGALGISVEGTGTTTRSVEVTAGGIEGNGSISIVSGTASDTAGNSALSASSSTFTVDNTPPTLSATGSSSVAGTTATISSTSNEAGTMYYVVTSSSTAPTSAQVKAGLNNSGTAAIKSGNDTVTANTAKSFSLTGLTSETQYYFYFAATDAATNTSNVSGSNFTTPDITPPTLSATGSSSVAGTTATISSTSNEAGTMYYVVTSSSTAPSSAQVKAGLNNSGTAAIKSGNDTVTANTAKSFSLTGLTSETQYYFYFAATDAATNTSNVSGSNFTTPDITPPTLSATGSSSVAGTTATISSTSNEAGTMYYVVTSSSTAPSSAQVKAGLNNSGTAAIKSGNDTVTANTAKSFSLTGLTSETQYYFYFAATDAATNTSNVSGSNFTTSDITPPTLSATGSSSVAGTTATISSTSNEAGTMYYVVTSSSTAPSSAQVKAGLNNSGTAAIKSGNDTVIANTAKSFSLTGLTSETQYYFYFAATDAATNTSNVSGGTFTTLDITPPTLTLNAINNRTTTSADISATSNESGTMYYVVTTSSTTPTNTQVMAGQDSTGTAAITSGSDSVSANTAKTFSLSGLTINTHYYYYFATTDEATNTSNVSGGDFITEVTPPTLTLNAISNRTTTSADISATSNESGTMYYVVTTSSTTPTNTQVMAGQDSTGTAALKSGNGAAVAATAKTFSVSGLTINTHYYYYFAATDAATNKSSVSVGDFITDITPPTLSATGSGSVAGTTATISSTSNEAGTMYYVVTSSSTAPSSAQVKAGTDENDAAALKSGSGAAVAATAKSFSLTGLTSETQYYFYFAATDAATNTSNVSGSNFTTSDITPPTLSATGSGSVAGTTATISSTSNEAGTMYYVVTSSSTAPTNAQVKAGLNNSGTAAIKSGNDTVTANTAKSFNLTGLTSETQYYFYFAATDAATNTSNVSGSNFTTSDITPPTLSTTGSSSIAGTTATISSTSNEAGTMYYVVTSSSTAPSSAQVKAGTDENDAAALKSGNGAAVAATAKSFSLTGLTNETQYYYYFAATDAATNTSAVSGGTFTTLALPAPSSRFTGTESTVSKTINTVKKRTSLISYFSNLINNDPAKQTDSNNINGSTKTTTVEKSAERTVPIINYQFESRNETVNSLDKESANTQPTVSMDEIKEQVSEKTSTAWNEIIQISPPEYAAAIPDTKYSVFDKKAAVSETSEISTAEYFKNHIALMALLLLTGIMICAYMYFRRKHMIIRKKK